MRISRTSGTHQLMRGSMHCQITFVSDALMRSDTHLEPSKNFFMQNEGEDTAAEAGLWHCNCGACCSC